ncbi:MAG: polysaccharide biosynthesis protein [Bacteroides sp.]|nr:polysaccharide biosynthesis protein [Bacteroides sp.]
MRQFIRNKTKFLDKSYFNYWTVLVMDLCISAGCTSIAYLSICQLAHLTVNIPRQVHLVFFSAGAAVLAALLFNTYRHAIRHSRLKDMWRIAGNVFVQMSILWLTIQFTGIWESVTKNQLWAFILFTGMLTVICMIGIRVLMILFYEWLVMAMASEDSRILIYGIDKKSVSLEMRLHHSRYKVAGFLTYGKKMNSYCVAGNTVYSFENEEDFINLIAKRNIQGILFAHQSSVRDEQDRLLRYCEQHGIKALIAPSISEADENGNLLNHSIRKIRIEDLLGREEISGDSQELIAGFRNKIILITGAAGSIGRELTLQLAGLHVQKLLLLDSAETPLHYLRLELEEKFPELDFIPMIGDVRIKQRLEMVFDLYRPHMVLHAAAYKHVPLMEENPCEAVYVNVIGSRQVADMCVKYGVEKMIMISTDKAVNPTNVMGASKRLAEIYVQSLGQAIQTGKIKGKTRFITTRFGNVLGSNGSVIPRFREQIENGGPVTVTHPDIIRFFMTVAEACRLVLEAAQLGKGNEIFVFKMGEAVKIADMARRMIQLAGYEPDKEIKIKYTGLRPGEKLYEEMLSAEENSIPTDHQKISIAKVRKYEYADIVGEFNEFERLSRTMSIDETVRRMKKMVPEFKSKNSRFVEIDRKIAETKNSNTNHITLKI